MSLWAFAVATYARPGVEAACLSLQDKDGQCAPLLLWRLWALAEGRAVDDDLLAAAVEAARAWDEAAVAPLRTLRRRLKTAFPPIGDAGRGALREDLKAAELKAERLLLDTLEAMTPPPAGVGGDAAAALLATAERWNGVVRPASMSALVAAAL